MKKTILLLIFFSAVIMTGNVSAQSSDYELQNSNEPLEVTYDGGELSFTVEKNSPGNTGPLRAEVCGEVAATAGTSGGTGQGGVSLVEYPATLSFSVPQDAPCSQRKNTVELIVSDADGQGEETVMELDLRLLSKGEEDHNMEFNKGETLYVEWDTSDDQLHSFFLTNDIPAGDAPLYVTSAENGLIGTNLETKPIASFDSFIIPKGVSTSLSLIEDVQPDGSFSSNIETVLDEPLPQNSQFQYREPYGGNFQTQSPVHLNGNYELRGGLIRGNIPVHYDQNENEIAPNGGPSWYVCDNGAMMDNGFGQKVPQVVKADGSNQLYSCNTETNQWEQTYQCEDGLDNDNDQGIDQTNSLPGVSVDDGCSSNQDTEVSCQPRIGVDDGTKYAYYDAGQGNHDPAGNNCDYKRESASEGLITPGDPQEFTCARDGGVPYAEVGVGTNGVGKARFCQELSGSLTYHDKTGTEDIANAVHYRVPAEAIPTTNQNEEVASTFVRNTDDLIPAEKSQKCIRDKGGFVNTRCETVHMAERDYAQASLSADGLGEHFASTWQERNMTDLEGYINDNPENYKNAWITGNASISTNRIDGESGPDNDISSPSVFDGGFAGNCKTGQTWRYVEDENRWTCSGALDWAFEYFVPDLEAEGGAVTTGIFFNSSIFYDGPIFNAPENSFSRAWEEQNQEVASIEKVHYGCYPGEPYLEQASTGDLEMKSVDIQRPIESDAVFLPYELSVTTANEYGCDFKFEISTPTGNQNLSSALGANEIESAEVAAERFGISNYLDLDPSYKTLVNQSEARNNLPSSFP